MDIHTKYDPRLVIGRLADRQDLNRFIFEIHRVIPGTMEVMSTPIPCQGLRAIRINVEAYPNTTPGVDWYIYLLSRHRGVAGLLDTFTVVAGTTDRYLLSHEFYVSHPPSELYIGSMGALPHQEIAISSYCVPFLVEGDHI